MSTCQKRCRVTNRTYWNSYWMFHEGMKKQRKVFLLYVQKARLIFKLSGRFISDICMQQSCFTSLQTFGICRRFTQLVHSGLLVNLCDICSECIDYILWFIGFNFLLYNVSLLQLLIAGDIKFSSNWNTRSQLIFDKISPVFTKVRQTCISTVLKCQQMNTYVWNLKYTE